MDPLSGINLELLVMVGLTKLESIDEKVSHIVRLAIMRHVLSIALSKAWSIHQLVVMASLTKV